MGQFVRPAIADLVNQVTQYRIKVRHRLHPPKPWKWEIYDGERLAMGSNESYASYHEAHGAGQTALDRLTLNAPAEKD